MHSFIATLRRTDDEDEDDDEGAQLLEHSLYLTTFDMNQQKYW